MRVEVFNCRSRPMADLERLAEHWIKSQAGEYDMWCIVSDLGGVFMAQEGHVITVWLYDGEKEKEDG